MTASKAEDVLIANVHVRQVHLRSASDQIPQFVRFLKFRYCCCSLCEQLSTARDTARRGGVVFAKQSAVQMKFTVGQATSVAPEDALQRRHRELYTSGERRIREGPASQSIPLNQVGKLRYDLVPL